MRGVGRGGLGSSGGRTSPAPLADAEPASPAPPPSPSPHAARRGDGKALDQDAPRAKHKADARPAPRWTVTVTGSASVGATAPLVAAVRAALASGPATCLAATRGSLKLRLTVDASGKVLRVDLLAGDRAAESCLRKLLGGLSSTTVAVGAPAGTIALAISQP
jgi:hypothetical protein